MVPSFLPLALLLGCAARSAAAANVPVCGAITTSTTWTKNNIYKVNCVTYVQPGATLTVEPGTVVEAKGRVDPQPAVAIIVHRGARIVAELEAMRMEVRTCGCSSPLISSSSLSIGGSPQPQPN